MRTKRTVKYYPSRVKAEAKKYGKAYVQKKYGMNVYHNVVGGKKTVSRSGKLEHVSHPMQNTHVYATKGIDHSKHSHNIGADKHVQGKGKFVQKRNAQSLKNAPPKAHGTWDGPGKIAAFKEGGMSDTNSAMNSYKRQMNFNLDNDEDVAQGQQRSTSQSTSISHLISGQLRLASNQPVDAWDQWAKDKGGSTQVSRRGGSPFGIDVNYQQGIAAGEPNGMQMEAEQATGQATKLAQSNPMGAFGTSNVMYDLGEDPQSMDSAFDDHEESSTTGYKQTPLPNYNTGENGGKPPDVFTSTSGVFNPWGSMQGSENNAMGPSSAQMGNATMESMALANAYFAPQRSELAYELGDMETDMRRLSVNLGRQVDDPVLQAKLYKEASRSVRTLDIQQNTFAFQMADARRKEENQNWQFYDQLSQEEARMRLANTQFYQNLDLQKSQYNLQNWIAQQNANTPLPGGSAPPPGGNTQSAQAEQSRYTGAAKSVQSTPTLGIYKRAY